MPQNADPREAMRRFRNSTDCVLEALYGGESAQVEINGRTVGKPLSPSETRLVLEWLESDGVVDAIRSLPT